MSRIQNRKDRMRVIRKRLALIKSVFGKEPKFSGMFQNNNEVNHLAGAGRKPKTNGRKECCAYRHHGSYGSAEHYSAHDQRQIDNMNEQMEEYRKEVVCV